MHITVLSSFFSVGIKWSCSALFIELLLFLLLIQDFNSLTLSGGLPVLGGVQPPFLYRVMSAYSEDMTSFIWSGTVQLELEYFSL